MELEQLRIFCTVAACRSFTRAAGQLFVSPSTTSRAVTALERELGVPLLTRDRHTVALTGAGAVLLTGAEALCATRTRSRTPCAQRRSRRKRRKNELVGLHKLFCEFSTFQ